MKAHRRPSLLPALLAAPLLLGLAGGWPIFCAGAPPVATAPSPAAQQFYGQILGDWVGTQVCRVNGAEPTTSYFHLVITRAAENTFQEAYTFYRIDRKTGALGRSGTQSLVSTIQSNGVIRQSCRGSGTVLIDYKPKDQSFEVKGEAWFTARGRLESELTGKIAIKGMPLNLGKNGKVRKATTAWSLEEDALTGEMRVETAFRALLITRRYGFDIQFRAQRGNDVQVVASRVPAS
jgi:hypothetical protein